MRRPMLAALGLCVLVSAPMLAQGGTEIYVSSLARYGASVKVGAPKNITRRTGYDNQPSFTADGRGIWYTSQREGQTDIYRYQVASDSSVRVTRTTESEYSATRLPDGSGFSVIRVEADSTQRLWSFRHDGSRPRLVLQSIKPVGYHTWASPRELVLFVLGEPPTLQRVNVNTEKADTVTRNPGRSLHRIPGKNAVSFVHKKSADEWWIRQLDLASGTITDLVRTLPGSEDYVWTPGGVVLMGKGSTLYSWNSLAAVPTWTAVETFRDPGMQSIKRLAISPNGKWIAMVSDEVP